LNDNGLILQTIDLTRFFGMVKAADGINVEIKKGEFVGIVGANGSGKTTFLNLVTGYLKPQHGRILFLGQECTGLSPRSIVKLGLARSFQIPQIYTGLNVLENLLLSMSAQAGKGTAFWKPLHQESWIQEASEILGRFGLDSYIDRPVSVLPEGGRKLLDIALSFALKPSLLLLDEPTSGVSIEDKFKVMDTMVPILKESNITTIFVEHDMDVIHRYSHRVLAFNEGKVIADGLPQSVLDDPEIRKAVLGHE